MRELTLNREHLEELGKDFELELMQFLKIKYPQSIVLHDKSVYCKYLEKETQLDLILITKNNVFVIEAKNWVDFIKGEYNDLKWEGRSRARNTMVIFNPINQNDIHIRALRNALRLRGVNPPLFINLVVVPDGTSIKSSCSEVITKSQLTSRINKINASSKLCIDVETFGKLITEVCV